MRNRAGCFSCLNIRGEELFQKFMERVKYKWEHFEE